MSGVSGSLPRFTIFFLLYQGLRPDTHSTLFSFFRSLRSTVMTSRLLRPAAGRFLNSRISHSRKFIPCSALLHNTQQRFIVTEVVVSSQPGTLSVRCKDVCLCALLAFAPHGPMLRTSDCLIGSKFGRVPEEQCRIPYLCLLQTDDLNRRVHASP